MKNLIYLVSLLLILSCNSNTDKAIIYNNTLLKEQQKIGLEIKSYLDIVKDTVASENQILLKEKLLSNIKTSLTVIDKLKNFDGNTDFKESVKAVLNEYYKGINTEYDAIVKYNKLPHSEKTPEKKWQAEQHAIHADEIITKAEDHFILMQKEFAEKHNIKLD